MTNIEDNLAKLQQYVEQVGSRAIPQKDENIVKIYESIINAQLKLAVTYAEHIIHMLDKTQQPQPAQQPKYETPVIEPEKAWYIKCTFGKHKGETLKKVYETDIEWLYWLCRQNNITGVIKGAMNAIQDEIVKKYDSRKDYVGSEPPTYSGYEEDEWWDVEVPF